MCLTPAFRHRQSEVTGWAIESDARIAASGESCKAIQAAWPAQRVAGRGTRFDHRDDRAAAVTGQNGLTPWRSADLTDALHAGVLDVFDDLRVDPNGARPRVACRRRREGGACAHTLLAKPSGDIDRFGADRTIVVGIERDLGREA